MRRRALDPGSSPGSWSRPCPARVRSDSFVRMCRNTHSTHSSSTASRSRSLSWRHYGSAAFVAFAFALPATAANVPVLHASSTTPSVDTSNVASLLVIDVASGKTLYKLNPDKQWSAASLTKLMTSYLFSSGRRNWASKGNIVKSDEVGGGRLGVPSGSTMTFRDLLYSAVIGSANNAANAMARQSGYGSKGFIREMNRRTGLLGMTNTAYVDASGMSPKNVSTAYDVALALDAAGANDEIQKAMVSPTYRFTVATPKKVTKTIKNTNRLLFEEPDVLVTAGKTGYLQESMYNYAVSVRPKSGDGGELAIVVFGAPARADSVDTATVLAKWAWESFAWSGTSTVPIRFNRNLGPGIRGADVKALQKWLNGNGTEKYGPLTQVAVKKFQDAHKADILVPQGREKGSGVVDFQTRAYLNTH